MSNQPVRICLVEVVGIELPEGGREAFAAARAHWRELSETMRRVTNDLRMFWLVGHVARGDHVALREWIAADRAWAQADRATRGPRMPCPVRCWPADLLSEVYHRLSALHPGIATRCVALALNTEQKTMAGAKAARGSYPRWMRTLCGDGEFPSSSAPQPVPFDKQNGALRLENDDQGRDRWSFDVRIDRIERNGRVATSTLYRLKLQTGGRRLISLRRVLEKVFAGEWAFKGSRLAFQRGEWYVLLCYQLPDPERKPLDSSKSAVVAFGRRVPLRVRCVPPSRGDRQGLRRAVPATA